MEEHDMHTQSDFDLAVIGSGPGGFEAAVRAARKGLTVCVIERGALGGVCVNWGCIPTKALLRSAEIFRLAGESSAFGLDIEASSIDLARAVKRSRKVVLLASKGVESALKKNKVTVFQGEATFVDERTLRIRRDGQEDERLTAKHIIIASGARPREIPVLPVDGRHIMTSREALALKSAPERMIVVGGGAIGLEMAWYYHSAGTKVTVLEMLPRLLPLEDKEVSEGLERLLKKAGISIHCEAAVVSASAGDDGIVDAVVRMKDGSEQKMQGECLLVAAGVVPNSGGLQLDAAGVILERGFIATDAQCRTNVDHIYAIGDVRGGMQLAHKASAEAVIAVESITGGNPMPIDDAMVPRCVYVEPAVAAIGASQEDAAAEGREVMVGQAMFAASGKASAYGFRDGFVKLIFDAGSGVMIGGHVLGHGAVELIGELSLAMRLGATADQIASTIHAHPTLSETVREAAENAVVA